MTIGRGAKGPLVKELQRRLKSRGYQVSIDGIYGDTTEAAVIQFQTDQGLDADGIAGQKVFKALGIRNQSSQNSLTKFHDSAPLASWIFGGLILLFLMLAVFVDIAPGKFPIIRFLMALSAAFFSLFFVGGVLLNGTLKGLYISATGGFVLFILIQFVFNPFEILPSQTTQPTPSPTVSTTAVTSTNSEETSKGDKTTLLAEFVLNERGEPQFILDKEDKVTKHYMIVFFVKDVPPDVTSITYDPWDPSYVKTYTSYAKPDFKLKHSDFTAYGDDHIKIIRRTHDSESSEIPMVLISTALERRYTGAVSDEIREAITVIKNNLQGD